MTKLAASLHHVIFWLQCERLEYIAITDLFTLLCFLPPIFWIPDFISHSASLQQLKFIFQQALPDMRGKTLVDVGSRLGVMLYGVSDDMLSSIISKPGFNCLKSGFKTLPNFVNHYFFIA